MRARFRLFVFALTPVLCFVGVPTLRNAGAQTPVEKGLRPVDKNLRPDRRRALASRPKTAASSARPGAYLPQRSRGEATPLARTLADEGTARRTSGAGARPRRPARPAAFRPADVKSAQATPPASTRPNAPASSKDSSPTPSKDSSAALQAGIQPGTPLSRVLHVSQLSLVNSDGTHEEFADADGDLVADDRTTFDARGGSYDIALGRSGARYEVFTAVDDRGTASAADDVSTGVLVVALDTNGDYVRDASSTFDLGRDFGLPSAAAVVSGTSRAGREFVVVSSSGYYNDADPGDPANERSPGVVLLVRDAATGGFDSSRTLVAVGDNRLFNANALALLPNGDLLVADFHSNNLRVVRDTDADGVPDALDPKPYYTFGFSTDAPLDVAANSRGVVFTHSAGADTYMLALYDTNADGYADADEVCVEGLSVDDNLLLHGLTVARDGTVYVIEDALGESDRPADGGNGGIPRIDAFPDPALNGLLRDGTVFVLADDEFTESYSGLAFGVETRLPPVARLTLVNSASLQGDAPSGGLATVRGNGLTHGLGGATQADADARRVRVTVEGLAVPVLSFGDASVHIQVPQSAGTGVASVVVSVGGEVTAADDARIVAANPGLFTDAQTGTGEAIALLVSGMLYTRAPFPARFGGGDTEVALFGTGWRNALPVAVQIGGRPAQVSYAGPSGFPGLDQLNVRIPEGVNGPAPVLVTTAGGATSRGGVFITVQ